MYLGLKFISWAPKRDKRIIRSRSVSCGRELQKPDDGLKIYRKAKRSTVGLYKYLTQIFPRPFWFVTVLFPKQFNEAGLSREACAEAKVLLTRLHREFRYQYPNGYLVWSIEHGSNRGLHVHYACRTRRKIKLGELSRWFAFVWQDISGNSDINSVTVLSYDHKHKDGLHASYLTSRKKLNAKAHVIKCFEKKYTWGKVGGENIPIKKPLARFPNRKAMNEIRNYLIASVTDEIALHSESNNSVQAEVKLKRLKKQLSKLKSNYSLHYISQDERKAILKILKRYADK